MGARIAYINFLIITETKTFCFNLPKDVDEDINEDMDDIIKTVESLE